MRTGNPQHQYRAEVVNHLTPGEIHMEMQNIAEPYDEGDARFKMTCLEQTVRHMCFLGFLKEMLEPFICRLYNI